MPGLKELEYFREELSRLGKEREVTAARGEAYEELPRPTAISAMSPKLDVDNLLASLGNAEGEKESPATPNAPSDDLSNFDDLLASLPLETPPNPKPAVDSPSAKQPPLEELSLPESPEMGEILDNLDVSADFSMPDFDQGTMPGDLLAGFADEIEETRKEKDDFGFPESSSVPQSGETDSGSADFNLDNFNFNDISMPDFGALEEPSLAEMALPEAAAPASAASLEAIEIPEIAETGADNLGELSELAELGELGELGELSASTGEAGEPVDAIAGLDALLAAGLPETGEAADETEEAMDFTPSFELEPLSPSETVDSPPEDAVSVPGEFGGNTEELSSGMPFGDIEIPDISADAFQFGGEVPVEDFPATVPADAGPSVEDFFSDVRVPTPDFGSGEALPALGEGQGMPSGGESPSPFGDDFSNFTIPEDLKVDEPGSEPAAGPADLDGFDSFSLDEEFLKNTISGAVGEDEFHIPGYSDFNTPAQAKTAVAGMSLEAGMPRRGGKKEVPLNISDADFRKFLDNLSRLPLNLRIAIEEFIAGDGGTELQKMELVHSVLGEVPVRKIARVVEDLVSRSIPIPKDFEKKSVADYEREKSSLKYVLMNRILPAATLFAMIAILTFCTAYLGWKFVAEPLIAEGLYKSGYSAIEDGRYSQSIALFDQAVTHWDKKKWYFRYARAYREKKQYISAEKMYERILDRFDNDKAGGLEYAEMLRTELRNFEKAETILRRRVLDNFVNDRDALLLLGDNYLDWADEDPEKFEAARKTYATLMELYGKEDTYLARMMRYFIRTDRLIEVLPLKDHFMGKGAKIGASDLVELSGYLLEKRYNPSPGDSQKLIDRIEDVRKLLDRAVRADNTSPEAHYNMGRFMVYNYKNELASSALSEALRLFEEARVMSPRRVLARVDSFRLLGEILAENAEYPKAQEMYAQGISIYEEQRANRAVRQDHRVGVLYADYADVDYFISGDYANALRNYEKAVNELDDTPSVRYRIGYIQYGNQDYEAAMESFLRVHASVSDDKNLLYGFGNTLFRRGDYYAAQGYLEKLMERLENERVRKGIIFPQVRIDYALFVEQYMHTANNLAATLSRISARTGDSRKNGRAMALLSDSVRAWDALTRNPETMIRAQGTNLAFLNIQNITHPRSVFQSEIYSDIPKTLENEKMLK